jgi:hypothetical protein
VSSAEAVVVGDLTAKDGAASTSMAFSSRTSSSSSESLRMMNLLSPGGPRTSQLRLPKGLLVNALSRETSAMRSPSLEDEERSTTEALMEDHPCSHTGEWGQCEKTSGGDISGGGDPDGAGGGVLAPSGDGLPTLERERARLMPLLSYIDCKCRFKNRASCTGYPDGQANCLDF